MAQHGICIEIKYLRIPRLEEQDDQHELTLVSSPEGLPVTTMPQAVDKIMIFLATMVADIATMMLESYPGW